MSNACLGTSRSATKNAGFNRPRAAAHQLSDIATKINSLNATEDQKHLLRKPFSTVEDGSRRDSTEKMPRRGISRHPFPETDRRKKHVLVTLTSSFSGNALCSKLIASCPNTRDFRASLDRIVDARQSRSTPTRCGMQTTRLQTHLSLASREPARVTLLQMGLTSSLPGCHSAATKLKLVPVR